MSAITGNYRAACKAYGNWAARTIHHPTARGVIADWLRTIRQDHGNGEALEFRNYLLWLGTLPSINSASWVNRYGRAAG